ncbi:MAG: helix-turn-helix transcriptional regulator [Mesorhizobium sp.]
MTPSQCKAARALKDWTQGELAKAAGVSDVTIRNYENGKTSLQPASLQVIRLTLEQAGIAFLADGQPAIGSGVSIKKD